jgi:hypothetical protein
MRFTPLAVSAAMASLALLAGSAWAADWSRTDSPTLGFSAEFPSKPKEEASTQQGVKMNSLAAGDRNLTIVGVEDFGDVAVRLDPDGGVVRLKDVVDQSPRQYGYATSLWSLAQLAEVSFKEGLSSEPVSHETVRQALKKLDIDWRRARQHITSPDLHYARKKLQEKLRAFL